MAKKKELSYTEAVQEIESILMQMESGELDVDELAIKVKRVTQLLKLCKKKLKTTEDEVNKILDEDLEDMNDIPDTQDQN